MEFKPEHEELINFIIGAVALGGLILFLSFVV